MFLSTGLVQVVKLFWLSKLNGKEEADEATLFGKFQSLVV